MSAFMMSIPSYTPSNNVRNTFGSGGVGGFITCSLQYVDTYSAFMSMPPFDN